MSHSKIRSALVPPPPKLLTLYLLTFWVYAVKSADLQFTAERKSVRHVSKSSASASDDAGRRSWRKSEKLIIGTASPKPSVVIREKSVFSYGMDRKWWRFNYNGRFESPKNGGKTFMYKRAWQKKKKSNKAHGKIDERSLWSQSDGHGCVTVVFTAANERRWIPVNSPIVAWFFMAQKIS